MLYQVLQFHADLTESEVANTDFPWHSESFCFVLFFGFVFICIIIQANGFAKESYYASLK